MLDRSPVRSSQAASGAPGEERCLRAAGSTHIWRHSALFSPVNTKTSERASAAVVRDQMRDQMRPVIGLVACHSKCSQPIRGGAQEAGINSLFCLQLQREAEERTWKYT